MGDVDGIVVDKPRFHLSHYGNRSHELRVNGTVVTNHEETELNRIVVTYHETRVYLTFTLLV